GVRPTSPTDFGGTAASPTTMPAPMAPGDPRRDESDPWAAKGAGPGFTPPTPATEPTPESQPQTFFEKFPTPQDAWKDWLSRMGQFLARQPGEVPNFPGPWGTRRTPTSSPTEYSGGTPPIERKEGPQEYNPMTGTFGGIIEGSSGGSRYVEKSLF
ncbi:hypothetical protein LCGC14_1940980, partial [marine sediment metagenome]